MIDLCTFPDDHRPTNTGVANDRTLLDDHTTLDLCGRIHIAVDARREHLEHETIALEEWILLSRVQPPSLQDSVMNGVPLIDDPLNGISDLQLATSRGFDRTHRFVNRLVEEIDADERQI